jgi:hypothetical protein
VKGVAATRAGYAGGPHSEPDLRRCVFAHDRARPEVVEVEFDPVQISLRHCSSYSGRATSRRVRTARAPMKTASIARGRWSVALVRQTIFELLHPGAEKQKQRGGCDDRPVCRVIIFSAKGRTAFDFAKVVLIRFYSMRLQT